MEIKRSGGAERDSERRQPPRVGPSSEGLCGRTIAAGGPAEARLARVVRRAQLGLALAGGGALVLAYLLLPGFRAEVAHAVGLLTRGDVAALRDYLRAAGPWAPVVSTGLMLLQALIPPIPGFVVAFANGLAFGAFWGGLLNLASTTAAAVLCFRLAQTLGRGPVAALVGGGPLARADQWFARWGAHAVLVARLVPFLSLDLISYAAGLTRMRPLPFLAATAVGVSPSMFLYAYLGERAMQYILVPLAVNTVLLGAAVVLALARRAREGATRLAGGTATTVQRSRCE